MTDTHESMNLSTRFSKLADQYNKLNQNYQNLLNESNKNEETVELADFVLQFLENHDPELLQQLQESFQTR